MFKQEFYFDMHAIDTSVPRFTMVFRGTCIIVTLELISEVLRVLGWIIWITLVINISLPPLEMS